MPLYDYRCTECGSETEVMHAIDGAGPATCDVCGGPMRKALSAPAIHFRGSGWAKKDARTASKASTSSASKDAAGSKSESGAATDSEAGGSKSTDAPTKDSAASSGATSGAAND